MRRILIVGLLLLYAGAAAAQVIMAPPAQDAAGKQFYPPPPGMAAIYFYSPVTSGPGINVFLGQNELGWLGARTYMRVDVAPGWHAMRCSLEYVADPESITLAPGDTRFVAVDMPRDRAGCAIRETSSDVGRADVLRGLRALTR